ncbi:MAG: glutathione S-transferase N-terminal domain-containing protein [Alphaproteobacteria bacterium]
MNRAIDLATSFAASVARLGAGLAVVPLGPRPERPLEIWEFEACPFCRKVRDALSMLDLEALVHPCPKGGERFRPEAVRRGGKAQFPWLVDPNTGRSMYESEDVVRYLFATYGRDGAPWQLSIAPLSTTTAAIASAWRPGAGGFSRPSRAPREPLELWSFEASPYCRLVREALCSLELPYLLHNVAKGSPSREAFVRRSGKMQVPWLFDPNTGVSMFESADIVAYLDRTYALDGRDRAPVAAGGAA